MLLKRLNRDEPERVFVPFENNEGAQLNADATVRLQMNSDVDGIKAVSVTTGTLWAFLGIIDANVADGNFGLAQVYGYRSTSRVFQTNTSQATGLPLAPVAGQQYLQTVATTTSRASIDSNASLAATTYTQQPIFAVLLSSIASSGASATISRRIWIRAL